LKPKKFSLFNISDGSCGRSERTISNKSLIRKYFRDISTPTLLLLCSANPPCFDLARVGPMLALLVVASLFEPTPREGKPLFAHERSVA
jgi:hypothetical protein